MQFQKRCLIHTLNWKHLVNIFQLLSSRCLNKIYFFLLLTGGLFCISYIINVGIELLINFSSFPHQYKYMLLPHFSSINIVSFSLCFNFKDNLFIILRYKCYRNFIFKSCETLLMVIVQLIILHAHTMTKRKPDHKHFF